MKKNKLNLKDIKVDSFKTADTNEVKGGRWSIYSCPHTGENTMDYLGCNSLDDFYCDAQFDDDGY